MKIPATPPVGHLIAYDYLWLSPSSARDQGAKTYPTAIVVAQAMIDGTAFAYARAISHSPPRAGDRALEIPIKLKRHLGLDDRPSWLYTDQLNAFAWPGPDLRPASRLSTRPSAKDSCVIGPLPSDWFEVVKQHLEESRRLGRLKPIRRDA